MFHFCFEGLLVDLESKDVNVFSTVVSTLVPTVEGSTTAEEPEIVDEEETEMEVTTKSAETTKASNDVIEDLFAVDTVAKEATTQEATTPPFQQTTAADIMEESDAKKHHRHPHPHHHHTTTSSTSLPSELDGHDDDTTEIPPEFGELPDSPEETTTGTPDGESELHHIPQERTTPAEDLAKHGILYEETTSGSTSAYVDNEEITEEPLDVENIPALDSLVTTTVAADSHTHKDHHHHHHNHTHNHTHHHTHPHHHHTHPHHHTTTTTSSFGGDVQQEVTTRPSDLIEHEGNVQEVEHTTSVAEDEHPPHGHGHHIPHHETTPGTTVSTEPEKPHEVHTHEPKGRRVHVPDVGSTTAVPVINEDERIPDADAEDDDLSAVSNVTRNPFDEIDEVLDSKEEGPSGIADEASLGLVFQPYFFLIALVLI